MIAVYLWTVPQPAQASPPPTTSSTLTTSCPASSLQENRVSPAARVCFQGFRVAARVYFQGFWFEILRHLPHLPSQQPVHAQCTAQRARIPRRIQNGTKHNFVLALSTLNPKSKMEPNIISCSHTFRECSGSARVVHKWIYMLLFMGASFYLSSKMPISCCFHIAAYIPPWMKSQQKVRDRFIHAS